MTKFCKVPPLLFLLTLPLDAQVPKLTGDLKATTSKARGTLTGGPLGSLSLNLNGAIEEENGFWVITAVTTTPIVSSTERVTVEKGTLIARKREIREW